MSKGFTLKCNECGNEIIITLGNDRLFTYDQEKIKIIADYSMYLSISCCICGQKIEEM